MNNPETKPVASERQGRLESWKEIAVFLRRQVRTVNLWEKREGLPVHRHLHSRRSTVFAFESELNDWLGQRRLSTSRLHRTMIAVLPFENLSGDPSQTYFSDGLTEEMISQLGRVRPDRLGVIARTSSMQYKGTDKSVASIGRELRVDYVLEGSVRQCGDRARITAQLIQVSDQSNAWSQIYDRKLSDIIALQTEVAAEIAKRVVVELVPPPPNGARALPPAVEGETYEAYEMYLKGRQYCSQRTEEGLLKAVHYFSRAIQIDAKLAVAHSALADAYNWLAEYGSLPPKEAVPIGKAAALKALEINPKLAEAHAALCNIKMFYDWDWGTAKNEYNMAIALNPSYAAVQTCYASCLSAVGRHEEACTMIDLASEFDPHSLIISVWKGLILRLAGRYESAAVVCRKTIEIDSDFALAHWALGLAYLQLDRPQDSLEAFEEAVSLSGENPAMLSGLGHAQGVCGKRKRALQTLQQLLALSGKRYVSAYDIALVHLGLRNDEEALRFLDIACEERSAWFVSLPYEPRTARLRNHPHFTQLVGRIRSALG
jgi:TolB-like protein/Tfp pilus assembly protein PilF